MKGKTAKQKLWSDEGRLWAILALNLVEIEQVGRCMYSTHLESRRLMWSSPVSSYGNHPSLAERVWSKSLATLRDNVPSLKGIEGYSGR